MRRADQTRAAHAPIARRRRLRPRLGFILLLALLVLIGRGLGLLGGGGEKQGKPVDAGTTATGPAPGPGDERSPVPAGRTKPQPEPRHEPGAAPGGEALAPPQQIPPVAVPAGSGVERDRFGSLLSLVATRTEAGHLGNALAALQHLRSLPLDASQLAALGEAAGKLEKALTAACTRFVQCLGQGQVLAGCDELRQLMQDGAPFVHPVLAASLRPLGLGEGLLRVPVQAGRPWPTPAPLARDRNVRVRVGTGFQMARVIDSRSDQVTLRVPGEQGVTFPTMPVVECEPIEPTAGEATEMGLAALHAGDGLLARLWLASASLRSREARTARAEQLADLLR